MDGLLAGVGDVGPPGLLVMVVLMLLTGRLVTAKQLGDMKADRDYWRETALKSNEAVLVQARTQIEQLELGRTQDHFIRSLPLRGEAPDVAAAPSQEASDTRSDRGAGSR